MPRVTVIGNNTTGVCDLGLPCCPHGRTGTNAVGSDIAEIDGAAIHCLHDTGPTNCPHSGIFESVQGSEIFEIDGDPVTLVGHATVCQLCGQSGSHSSGDPLWECDC